MQSGAGGEVKSKEDKLIEEKAREGQRRRDGEMDRDS